MIYYCIYKDECSFTNCPYRQINTKFSTHDAEKDLTINEFTCNLTGKKGARLVSDERIICDRYKECTINCFLKTTYLTTHRFERYFGHRFRHQKPFKCDGIGETVNLRTAGENVGSYISIWNQPNLFVKEVTKEG